MLDISIIPKGDYCYTLVSVNKGRMKTKRCPYWRHRKDVDNKEVNSQNYGYCMYLGKGDLEFNEEETYTITYPIDHPDYNKKQTANEIGISLSLLWDQVKMCGEGYDE